MIDQAPKTRRRGRQAPARATFRDSLTFNDKLVTLGEALDRPLLPGLYTLSAESTGITYLCVALADGRAAVPVATRSTRKRRARPAAPKLKTPAEMRAKARALVLGAEMLVGELAALRSAK